MSDVDGSDSAETPDTADASPLALQLAVRVEKLTPPTVPALCASAVLATVALLDDDRSAPGGEWHDAVTEWNGARIRKLVRRGRASAWERAQQVPGVTAARDGAEVRAFVPGPMDAAPPEVTKLQIQSTPLAPVERQSSIADVKAAALWIAITPHFEMSWGKQAAQFAHAGQRSWMSASVGERAAWDGADRPIVILHPQASAWDRLVAASTTAINDGGYTEIPPGTLTTVAGWGAI